MSVKSIVDSGCSKSVVINFNKDDVVLKKVGTLIINTHQVVKSKDDDGFREHYRVTFISKNRVKQTDLIPNDINGKVKQIVISDGLNDVLLNINEVITSRLLKYLNAMDFDEFRKEINNLDSDNQYLNRIWTFDCQRFCYYLQYGKEDEYHSRVRVACDAAFRSEGSQHKPGGFYAIEAHTDDFRNKMTVQNTSLHYYVCLADNVFVSKFGEVSVLFTSYQQIIDAYFPAKFTKGLRYEVL